MPILYNNPVVKLVPDRIVNGVAAFEKYKRALIIVDFGTATTFDIISEKGDYILDKAITPGIKWISSDSSFFCYAS